MLILLESAAGFSIFQVAGDKTTEIRSDNVQDLVKLRAFGKFEDTTDALSATTALNESKLPKNLKIFLQKTLVGSRKDWAREQLGIADAKLAGVVQKKLGIPCIFDQNIFAIHRSLREEMLNLIPGIGAEELRSMQLGLAHSLSRFKLKFSPEKVDTMVIQAIGLLDDINKELNTYCMRIREWYGWHFPELGAVIPDNLLFTRTVQKMGTRNNALSMDFSDILPQDMEAKLKDAVRISMGTEISEDDIANIRLLAEQIIAIYEYRVELQEYLKNRMHAIAPNLTLIVGELVGSRLIAHAGSLINLAKHPASTVQILGAEKALFRALKTRHATPKYGLIYHASFVGRALPKDKGKVSRVLANQLALSARVDALGETSEPTIAFASIDKLEKRTGGLEEGAQRRIAALQTPSQHAPAPAYTPSKKYNAETDTTVTTTTTAATATGSRKRFAEDSDEEEETTAPAVEETPKKSKKERKHKTPKSEGKKRSSKKSSKKDKGDREERKEKKSRKKARTDDE
eukprot:gnl/Trimastix_PCT/365.p2 GENE.gnl/Trimastix_PCT/365~~gnl/Trimastix_PCT/365.p2  ORF type:complete len:516 (-),score=193.14 gnl/Trimastix_PCT/365:132-1679(-)